MWPSKVNRCGSPADRPAVCDGDSGSPLPPPLPPTLELLDGGDGGSGCLQYLSSESPCAYAPRPLSPPSNPSDMGMVACRVNSDAPGLPFGHLHPPLFRHSATGAVSLNV